MKASLDFAGIIGRPILAGLRRQARGQGVHGEIDFGVQVPQQAAIQFDVDLPADVHNLAGTTGQRPGGQAHLERIALRRAGGQRRLAQEIFLARKELAVLPGVL